jgi:hypothetical protein
MQARKESLWRQLLGVTYALTVVFSPGEGELSIGLGVMSGVDAAVSGAIGLVAVPPVLLEPPAPRSSSTLANRKVPAARGSFRVTWGPLPCQGRLSCTSKSVATGAECGRVRWRPRDIASIGWRPGCRRTTSWK